MQLFSFTIRLSVALLFCSFELSICGRDFYEILEIERSATTRDIRRAYKKIALVKHPDKNQDNPNAHTEFVEITRAYEVLKDSDLRRKYDTYGEKALEDEQTGGRQYESWQYYNTEFGIYDEDQEVVTLSSQDFEELVDSTDDVWFVNFYSPRCSHCHDLAPAWRAIARELDGVIRIGAVNCGEEWHLCRRQGIHGYPSLVVYPNREEFSGPRNEDTILKFALKFANYQVHDLQALSENALHSSSWLITFCSLDGDCLSKNTRTKVAAMLKGIAKVAYIDCDRNSKLCSSYNMEHGTLFFKHSIQKGNGLAVESLEARDVVNFVLNKVDGLQLIEDSSVADVKKNRRNWLLYLTPDSSEDVQWRKLPPLVDAYGIQVGRVICSENSLCKDLHIFKTPSFVLFKHNGGHEIHFGRQTPQDVATWTKAASESPLIVLSPEQFQNKVRKTNKPWLVDFYAPWCPPCMRLLPKLRQAASVVASDKVRVGTIDCTVHQQLCRDYNIRSYPTTILYNDSVPHDFNEHDSVSEIVESVRDILRPPVQTLNSNSWKNVIDRKDRGWIIDFHAPWCGPCRQFAPEFRRLAKILQDDDNIMIAQVDCESDKQMCRDNDVRSYPTIRFYPPKSSPYTHIDYSGWHRDAQNIRQWIYSYLPSEAVDLRNDNFIEDVLKSETPWLVDFYAPWCGHCHQFAPDFELIARKLKKKNVKSGKVDCESYGRLCENVGVRAFPTVVLWTGKRPHQKKQSFQDAVELKSLNVQAVIDFVERLLPAKTTHIHDDL
ncbi:unnamed protein product [Dimorphilus gyrociliatus]|uniref:DnaJ homolog subfamily C member 10 n=1 Tax=Dimorphilus gyrociliatus TaxID=2664684 RepID=A0A7I8V6Q9_9ANNE|nr:unnamed protein product [Dimorphilus gyrociliatus]